MPSVFDALPGIEVNVASIKNSLVHMWDETAKAGGAAPSPHDVKATQMNFVLHFGFATSVEDAQAQFATMLSFSTRYPSRVVVLCPLQEDNQQTEMRAKIYGECFLGKSKGDTRCVEFVMLSYPLAARKYLEDQVSICLSTDLPLYYWAHRFSASSRLADYQYLLRSSKRVIFDTGIVPADAQTYQWPNPEAVRDLVHARLLPVRQSLGQFLSGFRPEQLSEGLERVIVRHSLSRAAEARVVLNWIRNRLQDCGAPAALAGALEPAASRLVDGLQVRFDYQGDKRFGWEGDLERRHAEFDADFGHGPITLTTALSLLSPEAALAEAVFF
jgi:hypothetical protein